MSAQVLQFFGRAQIAPDVRDWTQQELAEFYRVESALLQAGVRLETDRGLSDEGEPWFVFCRVDSRDVFIHFARIDGEYVVDGAHFDRPARGPDFPSLVRRLIEANPLARAKQQGGANVFVHPAALLIALVGAAFFQSNDAKASEIGEGKPEGQRRGPLLAAANSLPQLLAPGGQSQHIDYSGQATAVILSAILTLQDDLFTAATGEHQIVGRLVEWLSPTGIVSAQSPEFQATPLRLEGVQAMAAPTADSRIELADAISLNVLSKEAGLPVPEMMVASLRDASMDSTVEGLTVTPLALPLVKAEGASAVIFTTGFAPAPDIDAVDAVLAAIGSGGPLFQLLTKAVPLIEQLPTIIIDLIRHGVVIGNFETVQLPTTPVEPVQPIPQPAVQPTATDPPTPVESVSPPPLVVQPPPAPVPPAPVESVSPPPVVVQPPATPVPPAPVESVSPPPVVVQPPATPVPPAPVESVSPPPVVVQPPATPVPPAPVESVSPPPVVVQPPATPVPPAPVESVSPPPVVVQPPSTTTPPVVAPVVVQPESKPMLGAPSVKPPIMSDPQIEKAIASFIGKVEHLKVTIEGKTVILFDEDLLNPLHNLNMGSITFKFGDGSAVTLVGLAHELPSLSFFG